METNDIPEPLPALGPNPIPLTKVEKIAIVAVAVGVTTLIGFVAMNTLNLRVQTRRNDIHHPGHPPHSRRSRHYPEPRDRRIND